MNENIQMAWDSSPASQMANLTSPVLIIQGDSDESVEFQVRMEVGVGMEVEVEVEVGVGVEVGVEVVISIYTYTQRTIHYNTLQRTIR